MLPGPSLSTLSVASSSSSNLTASSQTSTPEMMELKRKLEMVTEELSLKRMKHAKKPRVTTASRGQMVIEIPEFPMEFYLVADQARGRTAVNLQKWFESFNKNPKIRKQPEAYHNWVQTRTVDLLPKVLNVIVNNSKRRRHKITGKDILSCRLVSKSWKQSIDQFLQESVPLDLQVFHQEKLMTVATCIRSDNYKSLLEMMYSLEKNKHLETLTPFPSGRLHIYYTAGMENRYEVAFNNGISTLLEFYGADLQSFTLLDGCPELDTSLIFSWLKKMPNLKTLQIQANKILRENQGDFIISKKDFPHLQKLITVFIFDTTTTAVSPKLTELVLSVNPQIRNLRFNSPQLQWWKLKQVSLTSLSIRVRTVTDLQSLAALRFPLEKLRLTNNGLSGDGADLGEVFQFLEGFEGTLKELQLDLKVKGSSDNWSLRLRSLEYLYLRLRRSDLEKKPYDFLLPLESLEVLEIILESGEAHGEADASQVIQLNGYFDRLYESNVWKLFPRLKKVRVNGVFGGSTSSRLIVYTREKLSEKVDGNDC